MSKMAGYTYVDGEVFPEERIGLGLEVRRPQRRRPGRHQKDGPAALGVHQALASTARTTTTAFRSR